MVYCFSAQVSAKLQGQSKAKVHSSNVIISASKESDSEVNRLTDSEDDA